MTSPSPMIGSLPSRRLGVALLVLRVGLGVFLLLWGIDKIVAPDATVGIFQRFYGLGISTSVARVVGLLEGGLSVVFLAGCWKTLAYGLGLALHAVSTLSTYQQLLDPFGTNHLFVAAIPVLAGFTTLFLLRDSDSLWCWDDRRMPW